MSYEIRRAKRSSAKPLIGLYSESGCGKTFSALLLAKGFVGDMSKVCMIETESGRGEVYADHPIVGGYDVLPMRDTFAPENYGEAISVAEHHPGIQALIIDSASHEWEGAGGVLSMAAKNEEAGKKGQLVWQLPKLSHARHFMLRFQQTPIPLVILCMRAKYPMKQIKKDGKTDWERSTVLEPKQSDDILFEMMAHAWIDQTHNLHISKPFPEGYEGVFTEGKPISVETGKLLAERAKGVKPAPSAPMATEEQLVKIRELWDGINDIPACHQLCKDTIGRAYKPKETTAAEAVLLIDALTAVLAGRQKPAETVDPENPFPREGE